MAIYRPTTSSSRTQKLHKLTIPAIPNHHTHYVHLPQQPRARPHIAVATAQTYPGFISQPSEPLIVNYDDYHSAILEVPGKTLGPDDPGSVPCYSLITDTPSPPRIGISMASPAIRRGPYVSLMIDPAVSERVNRHPA
ncbi:hypothetical protein BDW62DRAFT_200170 [Aspergillus aurantiobrunneus]